MSTRSPNCDISLSARRFEWSMGRSETGQRRGCGSACVPAHGGFAAAKPAGHGRSAVMAANQTKTVANGDASMLGTFGFGPSPGLH